MSTSLLRCWPPSYHMSPKWSLKQTVSSEALRMHFGARLNTLQTHSSKDPIPISRSDTRTTQRNIRARLPTIADLSFTRNQHSRHSHPHTLPSPDASQPPTPHRISPLLPQRHHRSLAERQIHPQPEPQRRHQLSQSSTPRSTNRAPPPCCAQDRRL